MSYEPIQTASGVPALQRLLALGRHILINAPIEAALCQSFAVSKQADWPVAALSCLGEHNAPDNAYWFYADPVHLILQRDYFSLAHPAPLFLELSESEALLDSLNQHFEPDGLHFFAGQSKRWYLRLSQTPEISTTLPAMAVGRDVRPFVPQGSGAARWDRLLNEMQMLLHEHPVNQQREARGDLPVNSLWLSGGGVLPQQIKTGYQTIWANDTLVKGLAISANLPCMPLPHSVEQLLHNSHGETLLVLETLAQDWAATLTCALRKGRIKTLSINLASSGEIASVTIKRHDLWKFWRRPKPVEAYFSWQK